jgi:hypothetical protein
MHSRGSPGKEPPAIRAVTGTDLLRAGPCIKPYPQPTTIASPCFHHHTLRRPCPQGCAQSHANCPKRSPLDTRRRSYRLIHNPARCPTTTPATHRATDRTTFPPACHQSPCRSRLNVCRLKAENVVYPPHTPDIKNRAKRGESVHRPLGPISAKTTPIRIEPVILTSSVPQGKVSPKRRPTKLPTHRRPIPPSALPAPTKQ